jgi:hypothetical protein
MLSLYRTKLPYNHIDRVEDLGVCIQSVKEDLHASGLFGSNGLIFVLPPGLTDNLSSVSMMSLQVSFTKKKLLPL